MDSYSSGPTPPPLPPPVTSRRRWQRPGCVVFVVVVGLLAVLGVVARLSAGGSAEGKPGRDDTRPSKATAGDAATPKAVGPPALVGKGLEEAREVAFAAGYSVVSHDASERDDRQWDAGEWAVCFQASAGQRNGGRPVLDLGVVRDGAPCPAADGGRIPWPAMPAVTGVTLARAGELLKPLGVKKVDVESAYSDVELPGVADPWKVCFQDPAPGKEIENPQYSTVYLKVAPPGAACPERPYAELHPDGP